MSEGTSVCCVIRVSFLSGATGVTLHISAGNGNACPKNLVGGQKKQIEGKTEQISTQGAWLFGSFVWRAPDIHKQLPAFVQWSTQEAPQ